MAKKEVDTSSDLGSLLDELSKVRKDEEKKKQEKLKEINQDSSFASMMAELSEVAKVTIVKPVAKPKKKILKEGLTLDGPAMSGFTMAVEAVGNVPVNRLFRKYISI